MIYEGDGISRRCGAPTTQAVTLAGHDGEGVAMAGRIPPTALCGRCADIVRRLFAGDDIVVVVRA